MREIAENIIHPEIKILLCEEIQQLSFLRKPEVCFYEASLIYEKNMEGQFCEVWVSNCSKQDQLKRLCKRSNYSQKKAQLIISSQLPLSTKMAAADFVINTNNSIVNIKQTIKDRLKL